LPRVRNYNKRTWSKLERWRKQVLKGDIANRDGLTCSTKWGFGCGQTFEPKELELDHVIPLAKGGDPFDKDNLELLCKTCHDKKDNEPRGKPWAPGQMMYRGKRAKARAREGKTPTFGIYSKPQA
jgi:5-methylcytosine-specific restriction endonuclease McrA